MQRRSPLTTASLCVGFALPLLVLLGSFTARSAAGLVLWEENGHYYLVVEEELSWEDARSRAASMTFMDVRGHLATITSEAENTFITTQLGDTAGAWLGGEQLPDSEEPAGGWQWSPGEPWVYTNWDSGEPNNTYFGGWGKEATEQSEERLHYHHDGTHWNDLPNDPEVVTPRFIVEWDIPINNDCVEPPADIVSWWPGEGNAQDSIGSNDGTLQGGTVFVQGIVGQAFRFDGADDYIRIPHHPSLNLASALTIEAWISPASTEGPRVIVSKWNDDISDWSYIFKDHNDSDNLRIELSESDHNDLADLEGSTSIPLETWVHVAATYDAGEGIARLYFNGAEDASQVVGSGRLIDASLTDLLIGATVTGGGILENFDGFIDEVSIYNRALSAEEITAIFNAGSAGKCKDTEAMEIMIDIKPDSSRNRINPKSKGVIPVAILTTDILDATTVDPLSVRFGPNGAKAVPQKWYIKDIDKDGEPDLVLHFKTRATGIRCGDTTASLTGETFDGNFIQGSDFIKTVGCKK